MHCVLRLIVAASDGSWLARRWRLVLISFGSPRDANSTRSYSNIRTCNIIRRADVNGENYRLTIFFFRPHRPRIGETLRVMTRVPNAQRNLNFRGVRIINYNIRKRVISTTRSKCIIFTRTLENALFIVIYSDSLRFHNGNSFYFL